MPMMFWEKAEERGTDSWVQRNGWPHSPSEGWHALLRIIVIRWAKSYPLGRSFIPHVRYRTGRMVTNITWIFLKDANVGSVYVCVLFCWVLTLCGFDLAFQPLSCVLARSLLISAILMPMTCSLWTRISEGETAEQNMMPRLSKVTLRKDLLPWS